MIITLHFTFALFGVALCILAYWIGKAIYHDTVHGKSNNPLDRIAPPLEWRGLPPVDYKKDHAKKA